MAATEKVLDSRPIEGGLQDPAWSPDGKTIACMILQPGDAFSGLVAFDVATGKQKSLLHLRFRASCSARCGCPMQSGLLALSSLGRSQIVFRLLP